MVEHRAVLVQLGDPPVLDPQIAEWAGPPGGRWQLTGFQPFGRGALCGPRAGHRCANVHRLSQGPRGEPAETGFPVPTIPVTEGNGSTDPNGCTCMTEGNGSTDPNGCRCMTTGQPPCIASYVLIAPRANSAVVASGAGLANDTARAPPHGELQGRGTPGVRRADRATQAKEVVQ